MVVTTLHHYLALLLDVEILQTVLHRLGRLQCLPLPFYCPLLPPFLQPPSCPGLHRQCPAGWFQHECPFLCTFNPKGRLAKKGAYVWVTYQGDIQQEALVPQVLSHLGTRSSGPASPGPEASLVAQRQRICLQCSSCRRRRFKSRVRKIPWRRALQPIPVFFPGETHEQRRLVLQSMGSHRVRHE